MLNTIAHGLRDAGLMAWQVWWALVLGFAISAIVQAWIPRERIQRALGGAGARPVALATGLGAASSSCSYAAVAIAKSLFQGGASAASALAFQFASTNLVIELGVVIWVLIGWQFTVAELLGGLLLIALSTALLRLLVSRALEERARAHARGVDAGHQHHTAAQRMSLRARLTSRAAWWDVAHNFRHDWSMLYREIALGFVLAGLVGQIHNGFWNSLFITHAPGAIQLIQNAIVGPLVAVLTFVCSLGNVPLAAVLWSGGIAFGGVIAFIFADLIVVPIVLIYRRYYGGAFTARIVALMFIAIVVAAVAVDLLFDAAGLIPTTRPTHAEVFPAIALDYKLFLNIAAAIVFGGLFALSSRPTVSRTSSCRSSSRTIRRRPARRW
ncbi:MAG: permease [Solirubrobacterales bacterium]|nr:permease [Solirubrobacterales bacterium]